jgi:hypothetical protein
MKRIPVRLLIPTLLPFLVITAASAGGWAVITVDDLPEYLMTGKPVTLTFTVRQHGITRLDGLKPGVRATAYGRPDVRAAAAPIGRIGDYAATLTFGLAGAWTIRIDSGFNANETTLLPIHVIDAGSLPPPPLSPAARGGHLFVAKGCVGCHRQKPIAPQALISAGPDPTSERFPPDRLRAFLADPRKTLKGSARPQYGQMPNLDLEASEIDALVAFINRD